MAEHILTRELTLDAPRDHVFQFFADAANLERITPPQLGFHITTPQPIEMGVGTLIDYSLRIRGIPVRWRTEITVWDPPNEFVDTQLSGPYNQWIHRHRFIELGPNQTVIDDEVRYRLPIEPLGDLFHFLIERELAGIFDFRSAVVTDIFSAHESGHSP